MHVVRCLELSALETQDQDSKGETNTKTVIINTKTRRVKILSLVETVSRLDSVSRLISALVDCT